MKMIIKSGLLLIAAFQAGTLRAEIMQKKEDISIVQSMKDQTPVIRGCIKVGGIDKVPEYRILFQGQQVRSDAEGFFSIPLDDQNLSKYSIVISKTVEHNFEKRNTIKGLSVIPHKEYRHYVFKRSVHGGGQWIAQEKDLYQKNFVIPEYAVVVLIDPKYVDHLEVWDVKLPEHVIKMPAIKLRSDVPYEKLARTSAKSILYFDGLFHETRRQRRKIPEGNKTVQLSLAD